MFNYYTLLALFISVFGSFEVELIFADSIIKTLSEMDVAPWIANWILLVSDGITWHLNVFNGI